MKHSVKWLNISNDYIQILGSGNSIKWLIGSEPKRMCKGRAQGLGPKVFTSPLPVSARSFFFKQQVDLSVHTISDYPYYSSYSHLRVNVIVHRSLPPPKMLGRKPKATTKVTLTSH